MHPMIGLRHLRMLRDQRLSEIAYAIAWKLGVRRDARTRTQRAIFERIYAMNEWGDPESRSGPGSTRARGAQLAGPLRDLFERHAIRTLLDAPCGDFNWMRDLTNPLESYVGVDVVQALVSANHARYGDGRHRFVCADITSDPLPPADLILCRDALIHLSFADIRRALLNFTKSGSRLLLTTTFIDVERNEDIRTGGWRPLNLEHAPFNFPPPIECVEDLPAGNVAPGKRMCLWAVESIPAGATGRLSA
jgi:hypothetical protein